MFDRSVLFIGAEGVGLGMLAEALALDHARAVNGLLPLRIYSATTSDAADSDPVMLRAMQRLKLDTNGLSLKPVALYAFAGAPRIDHVVLLGAELPAATRFALGENLDVRSWPVRTPSVEQGATNSPGARYQDYLNLAEDLRPRVAALVDELTDMEAPSQNAIAHSA
jgi:hypothetical protein